MLWHLFLKTNVMIKLTDYLDNNGYMKQTRSTVLLFFDLCRTRKSDMYAAYRPTCIWTYCKAAWVRGGVKSCEWLSADIDRRTLGRQPGRVSIEIQSTNPQRSTNISLERVDLNLLTVSRRFRSPRSILNMEKYEMST